MGAVSHKPGQRGQVELELLKRAEIVERIERDIGEVNGQDRRPPLCDGAEEFCQ